MVAKELIPSVGYARRSTDLQERSIPDQKIAVERWAAQNGYHVLRWYVDDAVSGTSARGREGFERMIKAAENGRDFRAVLTYDMSRFSRGGTMETGYYLHRLRLAGVETIFTAEGIPEGAEGELLQGVKSWYARQYSVKQSRDCIRGQHSSVTVRHSAMGGRAPYGYDRQYLSADGSVLKTIKTLPDGRRQELGPDGRHLRFYEPNERIPKKLKSDIVRLIPGDPARVKVVKQIFEWCARGFGCRSIVIKLNEAGIPGPMMTRWNQQAVKSILMNPCYRGALAWNRRTYGKLHGVAADGTPIPKKVKESTRNPQDRWVVVENVHQPLVSPQLFQKAHEAMAKRRGKGGLARPSRRYLLSGLIRCTHCKLNYWGCWHGAAGRKKHYYTDAGYRAQGAKFCTAIHIQADALDAWVLEQLREAFLADDAAVERTVEQFVKAASGGGSTAPAADRSKELASINARIQRTVALITDSDLDGVEELKAALVRLHKQREALEAEIAASSPVAAQGGPDAAKLRQWAYQKLAGLTAALRPGSADLDLRAAVHEFVDRIEIDPKTRTGTMYMHRDALSALRASFVRRERHGSSTHSWIVLVATRLGSPR